MTFKEASDALLGEGISLREQARGLGVCYQSVKCARLRPEASNYRKPPEGWAGKFTRLVNQKSLALMDVAMTMESA